MILSNQKTIVIFEGIATSGKTTLQKVLWEKLNLKNNFRKYNLDAFNVKITDIGVI